MRIGAIKILISECTIGVYLRWWYNGWHYFNFTNGYEITMKTESMDTQVTKLFSVISKIERPTRIKSEYSYKITMEGITAPDIAGFTGMLMAEKVMQYEGGVWREIDIIRGAHIIKDTAAPGYILNFEITRKELPNSSSIYQRSLRLYLGDTLCDLDEDEVIPINKQTNDIAEMQDRQSDFTAQFKIRKTREMKALFELSGETGVNTNFPFEEKTCKLISDNIEIITGGQLILDKVDDQYYYVSILSGNKNFFRLISTQKLSALLLPTTNHTWDVATMVATHAGDPDYVYPLCEPSDDGGIIPMSDDGDRCELYGGWIWPFVKVRAIWDEIFANAGFTSSGEILTSSIFDGLFMPIVSRAVSKELAARYLYSNSLFATLHLVGVRTILTQFNVYTLTDEDFKTGIYTAPFDGDYIFQITQLKPLLTSTRNCYLYVNTIEVGEMPITNIDFLMVTRELKYTLTAGDQVQFAMSNGIVYYYTVSVISITDPKINYGSTVTPARFLPDMNQQTFIKMICNMFGLIPETIPRTREVFFWSFNLLYENIAIARDWSKYLSERDDEIEFKFGDYAEENYMRYKESEDVISDNGMGIMQVEDSTLPSSKDVVELPISTCDEVSVMLNTFGLNVSRINFNKYNFDTAVYDSNAKIDARIVYVDYTLSQTSPPYEKVLGIRPTIAPGGATDINSPKEASSLEVSFPALMVNYAGLSRMLTKANLRRAKFNLPVYEVAGLKHHIPIYLSQYKAYFYVNKINNYIPGKLCTIDLIKL